jgi:hypothetical protein
MSDNIYSFPSENRASFNTLQALYESLTEEDEQKRTLVVSNSVWVLPSSDAPTVKELFDRNFVLLTKAIELAKKLSKQPEVLDLDSNKVDTVFKKSKGMKLHEDSNSEMQFPQVRDLFLIFIEQLTRELIPENDFIKQIQCTLKERSSLYQIALERLQGVASRKLIIKIENHIKHCSSVYSDGILSLIETTNNIISSTLFNEEMPEQKTVQPTTVYFAGDLTLMYFHELRDYLASSTIETISIPELQAKLESFGKHFLEVNKLYTLDLSAELEEFIGSLISENASQETLSAPNTLWESPSSDMPELEYTSLSNAIEQAKELLGHFEELEPYSEEVDVVFIGKSQNRQVRAQFLISLEHLTRELIPKNDFIRQMEQNLDRRIFLLGQASELLQIGTFELNKEIVGLSTQSPTGTTLYCEILLSIIEKTNRHFFANTVLLDEALLTDGYTLMAFFNLRDYLARSTVASISIPTLTSMLEKLENCCLESDKLYTVVFESKINAFIENYFSNAFEEIRIQG